MKLPMKKKLKLFSIIASSLLTLAYTNSNAEKADASLVINTPVDPSLFIEGALIGDVKTVDCTLSGGTKTRCYQMTIAGAPADPETSPEGPYCPPTIKSTAEEGGTWIDGKGIIYDVDGPFIENLATLYKDDEWQMYDKETGKITVINGARGCEVAGNPRPIPLFLLKRYLMFKAVATRVLH